ncbi:MAG: efflux RND transporter permease subunit, partial [Planctomycetes bacterium]|nr:efflux RND transporter permease subunit [Planctomycetota bacterium]
IQELQAGLPEGVRIVPFYDRTGLIHASIETLTGTLIEEIAVASLVVFLVLWHVRSAIVICATLPLAVLISFICMYYFGIASNIMSLSGIAISIGVLVDAGIVMTENAYNRLHERATRDRGAGAKVTGDTREVVIEACKVVGGPLFFSIVITVLSFAPVFVLGGLEGKMFNPLAYTKTFALVGVAVLAITLVPALIPTFVRGRLRSQQEVWLVRSFVDIYKPLLLFFLRHPDVIVVITGLILLLGLPVFPRKVPWIFFVAGAPFLVGFSAAFAARHKVACFAILFCGAFLGFRLLRPLGEEFMPPLDELSLMDMPITSPNANISQAGDDIRERDEILRRFPEVHQVVGKVGRADTPTDPAPVDMVETIVTLRPRSWWPKRKVRYEDALAEAERVRAELERLGVLRARESRLADLRALLAGAAESLGALSGHEGRLSGGELAPADVLEDALAAWRALAGAGHVEASELAKHESSLEGATLVYAAVLSTRPPSAPSPRADAYRGALRVLRGDVTTALEKVLRDEDADFANTVTMDAVARIDGAMRELSLRRLRELIPEKGKLLARLLRREVAAFLRSKGALGEEPDEACWTALEAELSAAHAAAFDEWILLEDVTRAVGSVVDFLVSHGKVERRADLLVEPPARLSRALDALLGLAGKRQRTLFDRTRDALEAENGRLVEERVKRIGWELQDFAPGALVWALIEEAVAKAPDAGLSGRKAASEELQAVRAALEPALARSLFLWRKEKKDIQQEMDSELQVPGWGNIWTQPIVNRVDMLSTGVRTMIGVKVFGPDLEGVQKVSNDIAAVLKQVRGAVDVLPDQVVGENYLEIAIDRERAARYGVSVQDIQDTIEVALGGKEITMTVEGRARFPVRVRYPRDHREDEESVRSILVPAGRASGRDRMEGGRGARSSGPMAQDGMDGSAAMPAAPIA